LHFGLEATVPHHAEWEGGRNRKSQETCLWEKSFEGRQKRNRIVKPAIPRSRFFYFADMKIPVLHITRMFLFIALAVAFGYALLAAPNVELVSATIFIDGFAMVVRQGIFVGVATEGIYSMFNPYGPSSPPLWIAQVVSTAITGFFGGILGRNKSAMDKKRMLQIGMAGFLSTLIFAVLTTLSFVFTMASSIKQIIGSFVFGLSFYITHLLSNTVIFLTLVPAVLKVLLKKPNPVHFSTRGKQQ
jgi:hypothetical protein